MVDCEDVYCRIKARARLEEQGFSPSDAFEIAEKVYKEVKEIVDQRNE